MGRNEFLTYLYDCPHTRDLARHLAAASLRVPLDELTPVRRYPETELVSA